ncbi:DUF421 domain-containing protein [Peteryoungia desertarenae]|uniref:DUF421 domain-containing protein n=2 Tax=Peteryoungia desertarenae TaxID=1813451 RepID=A0ABX6QSD9_9HYPH|nr:DUF421 domain-containing protein [Peteryoungia desertarenae]
MDFSEMFYQNAEALVRTLIVGTLAYITLIFFLRISGKRTLAKLNAFDLVVTVALGSTLSSVLLQESIALAEGAVAFAFLISAQYVITFGSVHWRSFARMIRAEPSLLAHDGVFCEETLTRQRLTKDEVMSAVRASGADSLDQVRNVVLESDGSISVVK